MFHSILFSLLILFLSLILPVAAGEVRQTIDAGRIIDYIASSDTALDTWWDATLAVYLVPFREDLFAHDDHKQFKANKAARDIVAGWSMVLANPITSKFVLLGTLNDQEVDPAAAVERAQSLALRMQRTFATVYADSTREDDDTNSNIEGLLHQVAAMIHCRLQEYKVPVDFESQLKLRGTPALLHRDLAVPCAEATIRKGSALTVQESNQVTGLG